ncbi:predicted protein [Postia placenta Mad-698-R]|uniref:Uncharacterized protein n=1 Tax=Postia placenta MAD-698-R-SB12 TaxID=670580 RepID=A0A1X6N3W9_9APHY|nr:hypothetical protein POSPLADRAFT_1139163 [Postia placenta MAD-698-R-SB12]EED85862.1 predicted protein [Postia placenta Mad-698-R]OSX63317.1 hypothetical protein POSPLADRAFT_1139163 [Postia placenta MAD-698-R-SB12]
MNMVDVQHAPEIEYNEMPHGLLNMPEWAKKLALFVAMDVANDDLCGGLSSAKFPSTRAEILVIEMSWRGELGAGFIGAQDMFVHSAGLRDSLEVEKAAQGFEFWGLSRENPKEQNVWTSRYKGETVGTKETNATQMMTRLRYEHVREHDAVEYVAAGGGYWHLRETFAKRKKFA